MLMNSRCTAKAGVSTDPYWIVGLGNSFVTMRCIRTWNWSNDCWVVIISVGDFYSVLKLKGRNGCRWPKILIIRQGLIILEPFVISNCLKVTFSVAIQMSHWDIQEPSLKNTLYEYFYYISYQLVNSEK